MIIALARLQFCRLSLVAHSLARSLARSAGKCPRGNGQIDSREAQSKRELLQNDLGLGLEFEGAGVRHCTVQKCATTLISNQLCM